MKESIQHCLGKIQLKHDPPTSQAIFTTPRTMLHLEGATIERDPSTRAATIHLPAHFSMGYRQRRCVVRAADADTMAAWVHAITPLTHRSETSNNNNSSDSNNKIGGGSGNGHSHSSSRLPVSDHIICDCCGQKQSVPVVANLWIEFES